jgi:nitrate reductase gamma subunit
MYDLLTGPVFVLAFAFCIIGLLVRAVVYIKGLDWRLDRVAYAHYPKQGAKGALRSIGHWILPFGSRNWRVKPLFTLVFFTFHLGLIITPLFLHGHAVIAHQRLGLSWPAIPMALADALTIAVLITGGIMLVRRFVLPEVRTLTTAYDIGLLLLTLAPFLTGLLAVQNAPGYVYWLYAHIILGEALLIAIPLTKLSHIVLFFLTRAQIGMDFGIKRGGMKGRGISW